MAGEKANATATSAKKKLKSFQPLKDEKLFNEFAMIVFTSTKHFIHNSNGFLSKIMEQKESFRVAMLTSGLRSHSIETSDNREVTARLENVTSLPPQS